MPGRPTGSVSIASITDSFGKNVPISKAIRYGWVKLPYVNYAPDYIDEELSLGDNLFVDNGRQLAAYCLGFRSPISDFTLQKYGVGTGTTASKVTDVALESPITLASVSSVLAPIDGIDYLSPFVMRVSFTLASGDANGYLITERGLFSGNGTLITRHTSSVGLQKTSDFSPTLTWRLRF